MIFGDVWGVFLSFFFFAFVSFPLSLFLRLALTRKRVTGHSSNGAAALLGGQRTRLAFSKKR